MRFAAAWGFGHALTLLAVGGALFAFRREMPSRVGDFFELGVAVMLVGLGVRGLVLAARHGAAAPAHAHGGRWTSLRRPLLVGLMHGLAGSGALAAMVMSELPSLVAGLLFMALYGFGAMCGMAALAGVAGVPLARVTRTPRVITLLVAATGLFSLGLGVAWGAPLIAHLAG